MQKGILLVVSGPAGVGKGTIIKEIMAENDNIHMSVSATTRNPRAGDSEGVTYYFKTKDEFSKMIKNDEMLEWAVYSDNFYGTPKTPVIEALEKGNDVILEIEVQGALQVKAHYPEGVFVFVMPPSLTELERRITDRGTESKEEIEKRMSTARKELEFLNKYNYIIINEDIKTAADDLAAILRSSRLTKERHFNKN